MYQCTNLPMYQLCGRRYAATGNDAFLVRFSAAVQAEVGELHTDKQLPLLQTTAANHYCEPLLQTSIANHYCKPLQQTSIANLYCEPLLQTPIANLYRKPLLQTTIGNHYRIPRKSPIGENCRSQKVYRIFPMWQFLQKICICSHQDICR